MGIITAGYHRLTLHGQNAHSMFSLEFDGNNIPLCSESESKFCSKHTRDEFVSLFFLAYIQSTIRYKCCQNVARSSYENEIAIWITIISDQPIRFYPKVQISIEKFHCRFSQLFHIKRWQFTSSHPNTSTHNRQEQNTISDTALKEQEQLKMANSWLLSPLNAKYLQMHKLFENVTNQMGFPTPCFPCHIVIVIFVLLLFCTHIQNIHTNTRFVVNLDDQNENNMVQYF